MWELFWPLCKSPACLWALRMQTCGVCWCFPFCFKKWHLQTWKTGWTALPEETEIWGPWAAGMTLIKIVLSTCWLRSTRLELVWYAESGPRNGQHCRHAKTLCSRSHVAYKGIPCTYCLHTLEMLEGASKKKMERLRHIDLGRRRDWNTLTWKGETGKHWPLRRRDWDTLTSGKEERLENIDLRRRDWDTSTFEKEEERLENIALRRRTKD